MHYTDSVAMVTWLLYTAHCRYSKKSIAFFHYDWQKKNRDNAIISSLSTFHSCFFFAVFPPSLVHCLPVCVSVVKNSPAQTPWQHLILLWEEDNEQAYEFSPQWKAIEDSREREEWGGKGWTCKRYNGVKNTVSEHAQCSKWAPDTPAPFHLSLLFYMEDRRGNAAWLNSIPPKMVHQKMRITRLEEATAHKD